MPRPRGPEDRKPPDAPCFLEEGGTRWELPFTFNGSPGLLVIRTFDHEQVQAITRLKFDHEMSIRGWAVVRLGELDRRPRR